MKLRPQDARRFFASPDPARQAILIYGTDPMRVALRRQELVAALVGPEGEGEMRIERIAAGDLRKDPARLVDAIKAVGFFAGQRVVHVEDATDAVAAAVSAALEEWREGDAFIVVTAGQLGPRSALRKLFEQHPVAAAAAIYDDPPGREEIERELARAGLGTPPADAQRALLALAHALDPGDFRQTLEKITLYKHGDETPLSVADIEACAPATSETALDDAVNAVAEGRARELGPLLGRLSAQGVQPVQLLIAAMRHFRLLLAVVADPGGPSQGVARLRPPVYGPRRDRLERQARALRAGVIEQAIGILADTDLAVRAPNRTAPPGALVERALIRVAMLAHRKAGGRG